MRDVKIEIDHHSGVPIYRQIADFIRREIAAGNIKEDEPLISVRELAASLKVNPLTVSKAYSCLERDGLIERRRGIGMFVSRQKPEKLAKERSEILTQLAQKLVREAIHLNSTEEEIINLVKEQFKGNLKNEEV